MPQASPSPRTAWICCCEGERDGSDGGCTLATRGVRSAAAGLGCALPHPSPLPCAHVWRRAEPRPDPRLGRQPLLLPDQHPAQGCRPDGQVSRPGRAPALGPAHHRPRWPRGRGRRHRGLDPPGRGSRTGPRDPGEPAHGAAGRALRRRCLRQLRAQAPWEEGICSSLTELFAPEIHQQRLQSWPERYPWIEAGGCNISATA